MHKRLALGAATLCDLALAALGLGVAWIAWNYGFGSLARPGPGLYPFFVGTAITVFALRLLVTDWRCPAPPLLDRSALRTVILIALTCSLWIVAMPLLGYVVVTLLACFAFCKILKLEGWGKPLAVSGGTAAFIYLLFDRWLYIDLPRGVFG